MKKTLSLLLGILLLNNVLADEGMLIPSLIKAFESDMKAKGMRLSAEDIYSVNSSSLKDAIFQFGGGCTGLKLSLKRFATYQSSLWVFTNSISFFS